jgi:hypothetical protein
MARRSSPPADPLTVALEALSHLDRAQLLVLRDHLLDLLAVTEQGDSERPADPQRQEAEERVPTARGPRGGGYIEWKHIRKGDKVYGPYPYWRVKIGNTLHSFYYRALAQSRRPARQAAPPSES